MRFLSGDLCNDHADKYQRTANHFGLRQLLLQQQPSKQHGKDRFQTHQQGSNRGIGVLLTDDLEGIAHTCGKNAGVADRQPALQNTVQIRFFCEEHNGKGNDTHNEKLHAAQADAIQLGADLINDQNVSRKCCGTAENQQLALSNGHVTGAEQVQTRKRQNDTDPNPRLHPAAKQQPCHGNQNNIQGGDKTCFACFYIL